MVTVRLRDCAPVPHDLVHVDQAPNADVAQWIGHGPWLHACVSAVWLQALPPKVGSAITTRLRDCVPAPHDAVQVDQTAGNAGSTQSVGQAWPLQERASCACGQALPPSTGAAMARLRFCEPVPHDVLHAVQAENVPMTQSAAHGCALQPRVSAACGHALPPFCGAVVERLRVCEPPPHDLVHVDQAPNVAS